MQSEQQYEQLLMQYQQLKNGAEDIGKMIDNEEFDSAITMIKNREKVFLNCKCISNYLELTEVQKNEINKVLEELKTLEMENIKKLQKGMEDVQTELTRAQKSQKLHNAYDLSSQSINGSMVNIQE